MGVREDEHETDSIRHWFIFTTHINEPDICITIQASSLHLEQEAKEQESRLQQAYTRVENGEAPDEQTQEEWEKMIRDEYRRRQAALEKMVRARVHVYSICGGSA